jgi:membrane protease subunit (stomatin/prohibitin family)
VAFRDRDLGLVRLRAFGVFNIRIVQPVLFVNRLVGTQGVFSTQSVADYLNQVVVSRFNDHIGEQIDTIFDLPARYDELSKSLADRLREDFSRFGLNLTRLYINAITPPPEVQKAIDDKSRMAVFDDMNKLMQMKTAMAMEKIAENPDGTGAGGAQAGMGMGLGLMLPGMFARQLTGSGEPPPQTAGTSAGKATCAECRHAISEDANFCPFCGHQQVIFEKCTQCGKNITPNARFCPRCGTPVDTAPKEKICARCGAENLPDAVFCNQCGERH